MSICRASRYKRRPSGGRRAIHKKKRKFEAGRPAAMTKLGNKRIHLVRGRGGNNKHRALRLDTGNFSWGSEACTKKTRILDVVYNASNNELVRTKTLVKNAIVLIDSVPFRQWYENHYHVNIAKKGQTAPAKKDISTLHPETQKKIESRRRQIELDPRLNEMFAAGRVLAAISSRPGQCGRADGYILEGKELEFYQKQLQKKKSGKSK